MDIGLKIDTYSDEALLKTFLKSIVLMEDRYLDLAISIKDFVFFYDDNIATIDESLALTCDVTYTIIGVNAACYINLSGGRLEVPIATTSSVSPYLSTALGVSDYLLVDPDFTDYTKMVHSELVTAGLLKFTTYIDSNFLLNENGSLILQETSSKILTA